MAPGGRHAFPVKKLSREESSAMAQCRAGAFSSDSAWGNCHVRTGLVLGKHVEPVRSGFVQGLAETRWVESFHDVYED